MNPSTPSLTSAIFSLIACSTSARNRPSLSGVGEGVANGLAVKPENPVDETRITTDKLIKKTNKMKKRLIYPQKCNPKSTEYFFKDGFYYTLLDGSRWRK